MNETGCKCPFYIGGKCTDEGDYVNRHTGEAVCFRDPDAIPREMFEKKITSPRMKIGQKKSSMMIKEASFIHER